MKTFALVTACALALTGASKLPVKLPHLASPPKKARPAQVEVTPVSVEEYAESPPDKVEVADAVSDEIKRAKEKAAANVDRIVIKAIRAGDDPPPQPTPPPNPTPPPEPPAPTPPPVVQPFLTLPDTVLAAVGMPVKVKATTNGAMVRWFAKDDGLAMIDAEIVKDSAITQVWANQPGNYRLLAYTSLNDVLTDPVQCMVVVHGPQPPPVPVPPQPTPPPQPVPVPPTPVPTPPVPVNPTAAKLWVVVVDDVTKRDGATATVLTDQAMKNSLAAAGHIFKNPNITTPEAQAFIPMAQMNTPQNGPPDGKAYYPTVILMDQSKTVHNWLNQNPADLKLPTTSQGLKDLVNKYTTSKVQ